MVFVAQASACVLQFLQVQKTHRLKPVLLGTLRPKYTKNSAAGFYSLSATHIPLTEIPPGLARKLPRYPTVPVVLIGWLGRDIGFRGQQIGAMLLHDAIVRVGTSRIGVYALCADAIDEAAVAFYRRFLFTPFESRPTSLFLPLATALKAI